MKTCILINAQCYVNSAYYEGGSYWKPKGGFSFMATVDMDTLMYSNIDLVEVLGRICKEQSTDLEKFTYLSHQLLNYLEIGDISIKLEEGNILIPVE